LYWLFYAKSKGPVGLGEIPKLLGKNQTAATVPFLLDKLPTRPKDSPYVVWLDNLFGSTKLLNYLRSLGYGCTATACTNSGICKEFVAKKQLDKKADIEPWGILYQVPTIDNKILQSAWKDNTLVLFLSTTHSTPDLITRHRKRPSTTSTSARTARAVFGSEHSKDLPIPTFIDDCSHCVGQVDQADQLRATNPGLRRIRRGGWQALWHFLFNVTLVNSFLLSQYKDPYKFRVDLQHELFNRGTRVSQKCSKPGAVQTQDHKLASGQALRYCAVCKEPPTRKRKRSVLGDISVNAQPTPLQKRNKTTFGCSRCGVAV
jgi:hypothetical protein